ncbi:hypothetical protein [Actinomycetospora cinnamomea]|uniref:hypothetical protein n=1 Tax=Actinomycetospora cinnamomea TaxID=663609 RepID=UPI001A9C6A95|nr:hypothetical protein [Actinomycetospora cinnamomea]
MPAGPAHEHTRACWWDHLAGRWAGPAHPAPVPTRAAAPGIPEPRPAPDIRS